MSLLPEPAKRAAPWWSSASARDGLVSLANKIWDDETQDINGVYAYSLPFLRANFAKLKALKNVDRVFYAMKANSNKTLLQELYALGASFECVSLQELRLVKTLFPAIPGNQILFTPNFAAREEFKRAAALFPADSQPFLTIDNLWVLENWGSDFAGRSIFLRVDPGEDGHGHHAHVYTGSGSKFGIMQDELRSAAFTAAIAAHGITVVGLHMHKGSGITDANQWSRSVALLTSLRELFPSLRYVDAGGGLGVPYKPSGEFGGPLAMGAPQLSPPRNLLSSPAHSWPSAPSLQTPRWTWPRWTRS